MPRINVWAKILLREHWPALILAVLVGFNLVLPALTAKIRYGIPFDNPANIPVADEFFYFARVREVIDGHPTLGNPYLWEHKSKPPSPVFLGEYMVALPIMAWQELSGETQPRVVAWGVFYDFFFPVLITILVYACLIAITRSRWLSLLAAVLLLWGLFPSEFIRLVSPQFNFLFWLSLFFLSYLVIRSSSDSRQRWVLISAAALNFGALFYLYTYYWTFYLAFFVIFAALAVWRGERAAVINAGAIVTGGLLVAIPYFLVMLRAVRLPEYAETLRRIGMIDSHFPSGIAIVIPGFLILAVILWLLRRRVIEWNGETVFFTSGVLAAILSVNQHVITGKNLEFSSHYYLLSIFWFTFTSAYLLRRIVERPFIPRHLVKLGVLAVTAAIVLPNLYAFTSRFVTMARPVTSFERAMPLFNWIDHSTTKDDVVMFIPASLSGAIPIYTSANVYFSNGARLYFVSDEELIDRFIVNHFFTKIDEDLIRRNQRALAGVYDIDVAGHAKQGNKLRRLLGLKPKAVEPFPVSLPVRVREREKELRAMGFEPALKRFRIDYIVWDRFAEPTAPLATLLSLTKVAEVSDFVVLGVD